MNANQAASSDDYYGETAQGGECECSLLGLCGQCCAEYIRRPSAVILLSKVEAARGRAWLDQHGH